MKRNTLKKNVRKLREMVEVSPGGGSDGGTPPRRAGHLHYLISSELRCFGREGMRGGHFIPTPCQ